ncbi:BsuPI-related putative proteinase inhibitor [Salirhabdus sp. Marseille-P4669]|uniref:BsuPI-related putative proteinase inhibitor n=1 Tax=Salirhabdus sp. Marseille-P4669 TaxID=2042310 RepID=UPI00135B6778|nr:BsuPI-related putative proteinase inhibitor [Salirhabdus sp. Marseille-P4669]
MVKFIMVGFLSSVLMLTGYELVVQASSSVTFTIADKFEPEIEYTIDNQDVNAHFIIKNKSGHPFTFHFDTHQQFDYILFDEQGKIVQQYSKIMTFSKIPTETPVKPGGSLHYEVTLDDLPAGKYRMLFILMAKELQVKESISFEVS